jgi:hypothetical protein
LGEWDGKENKDNYKERDAFKTFKEDANKRRTKGEEQNV